MVIWLLPLALLLGGAGLIIGLPAVPAVAPQRARLRWGAAGLVVLAGLLWGLAADESAAAWPGVAPWSAIGNLTPPLALQASSAAQTLGLALVAVTLAAILAAGQDPAETRAWALMLVVLAGGLLALLPANLLSLALVWTLLDLVVLAGWQVVAAGDEEGARLRDAAALQVGTNAFSTLLLWVATLPLQKAGSSLLLPAGVVEGWMGVLLMLALLLRLAPFPFHLGRLRLTAPRSKRPGLVVSLQIVPLAAGVWLLAQIPDWAALSALWRQIFSAFLLTGLVGSGLLAWLPSEDRRAIRWLVFGQAGTVALAALWAGSQAALAEGMVLLLAGGLLMVYSRRAPADLEARIAGGLGIAALAGLPLTWGGDGRLLLFASWLSSGGGLHLFLMAGAYLLLLGAAIKLLLRPTPLELGRPERIAAGIGLGLPALGLLTRSAALPVTGVVAWIALVLPLAGAALLAWGADSLRPVQREVEEHLQPILSLDWMRHLTQRIGRLAGQGSHAVHQVLEGEGALLWLLIILALGWLLLRTG